MHTELKALYQTVKKRSNVFYMCLYVFQIVLPLHTDMFHDFAYAYLARMRIWEQVVIIPMD